MALSAADHNHTVSTGHVLEAIRLQAALRLAAGDRSRHFQHPCVDIPGHLFEMWQMPEGRWQYLGFSARTDGFDPSPLKANGSPLYVFVVAMRFVRLVIVAPLIEELFWRGFMMRYLVDLDGDYWKVPFGTFNQRSLLIVTAMVVAVHAPVDYAGALIFGLLMYGIAVRTKSLSACVIMHATANLILGLYVMNSHKWGYW